VDDLKQTKLRKCPVISYTHHKEAKITDKFSV